MHPDHTHRQFDARRVVQAVFHELSLDTRFAPRARALLVALQPVARAAGPQEFLARAEHPLRVSMACLAEIALGLGEYDTVATEPHFAALERFTRELRAANADIEAIEGIAASIQAFVAEETRAACLTRRRSELSERARVLGAMARAAIEQELLRELGHCRLPSSAEELLRDAWQRALAHAWFEQGPEGMPWRNLLQGLRGFITLWRDGAARVPRELGDQLCAAVRRAGGDALRAEILLQAADAELGTWEPPAPVPALMQVEEDLVPAPAQAGEALGLEAADALALGTWLMLHDSSGGTRRARLALRCGEPEQLLLVDRHGRRALGLERAALARALANGQVTVIPAEDPITHALARLRERIARRAIAA